MHRPKTGILKAKQLKELKLEEELKAVTKFTEKKQGNTIKQQLDNTL